MKRFLYISNTILLLSIQMLDAQAASIQVDIAGFKSSKGQVMVQLYDGKSGWSEEQSMRDGKLAIENGQSTWQLDGLPPGEYAIRCFHGSTFLGSCVFSAGVRPADFEY